MLDDSDSVHSQTFMPVEILNEALTSLLPGVGAIEIDSISLANATQVQLELLFSKYQTTKAIAAYFRELGCEEQFEELGIPTAFGVDLMVQMVLHKRTTIPVLVGILKKHFQDEANPAQACADAIHKACSEDILDWDPLSKMLVIRWDISPELQTKIDQFQYPLPMIEEPLKVSHNRQTGYRTIKGSLILKNNHHEDDICLDHINRVNQIPLALNPDVVAFVQNRWRNLDKPKPGEKYEEFKARKKAFQKFDRTSREVIDALLAQGNRFWLTHKYDKRGRTYSQGYHVNYQSNDWCKACIEFSEKEPLNQE